MNVVVVGAGVIGVAIAESLASRGARVTVLDMRSPGRGASQASAGLLTPYIEGRSDGPLLSLCARGLELWEPFVQRLRDRGAPAFEYARTGTLEVALSDDEAARLVDMRKWLAELQVSSQWFEGEAVSRFEPAVNPKAIAGLWIPSQGFVAVSALVKAITHVARMLGAQFESPVEVVRIDPRPDGVDIRADGRHLEADAVVVATGTWSGRVRIAGAPALPVHPIRGQLLQLTWKGAGLPARPVWGSRSYTVPWQPDTLLVGATVEDAGFEEQSTVAGVHELLDGVGELLPAARDAALAEVRVGLRPATRDGLPIIGPLTGAARVTVATGHYRNGVLLAPLTAQIVANYVIDGIDDPAFAITSPARFSH